MIINVSSTTGKLILLSSRLCNKPYNESLIDKQLYKDNIYVHTVKNNNLRFYIENGQILEIEFFANSLDKWTPFNNLATFVHSEGFNNLIDKLLEL